MSAARTPPVERQITVEFQVPESEADKVNKLVAYAKRIGVTQYACDSFEPDDQRNPRGY